MTLSPKEIWQLGFDLNDDVAWRFAPRRLRQAIAAIQDRPDEQPKHKKPEFETAAEAFQEAANLLNNYIQSLRPAAQILEDVRRNLIDLIKDGFFLSVGFPLRGGIIDDQPRHIPLGLWDMRFVYWNKSSVKGLGHEFVSVRVARESDIAKLAATNPPADVPARQSYTETAPQRAAAALRIEPTRGRGHPSRADEIRLAYRSLRDAEKIDFEALSRNYGRILDQACHFNADPSNKKGLKRGAVRTAIREEFIRDRQERGFPENSSRNPSSKK